MRTHVDFFSGLGSWAIAAANNGLQTIALCEREEWLAKGLEKIWKVPCYRDINSFPSQDYANRIWLLTGSPPCQPASRAGKQGGAGDVRWLWPQTIRHTEIIKPTWFCYENPPGIADVGLDGIIVDLERIGYEVQPIRIPACAVDSPQDRDRFWILGHRTESGREGGNTAVSRRGHERAAEPVENGAVADSIGRQTGWERRSAKVQTPGEPMADSESEPSGGDDSRRGSQGGIAPGRDAEGVIVADSSESRFKTANKPIISTKDQGKIRGGMLESKRNFEPIDWADYQWIACPDRDGAVKIRRAPTGLHDLAYGVQSRIPRKFHSKMIAALGNAIVWRVADQIIKAILENEA